MTAPKSIFVYCEAAPVDDNIPAQGLYRASAPIFRAIRDHIVMIALYPLDRRYGLDSMHPALRPLARALPKIFSWWRSVRKRLLRDDFENGIVAHIVGGWARRSAATQILSLEGSDSEVLARVDAIAARAGLPFSVYMVDDHAEILRRAGRPAREIAEAGRRMSASLKRARQVFVITPELGELVQQQFGVTALTLPLAFEPGPRPDVPVKDQIFFLGSVNFLYLDGLRTLMEIVARLRAETGRDITIRLTSPGGTDALGTLPPFVIAAPIAGAEALAAEIAASLFAFLPYSFDPALRTMVATSFPSKSMECLAYARSILVFGPSYGNSTKFFMTGQLPAVVETPEALELQVRRHLAAPPDHSAQYRDYLARKHAPAVIREILLSAL